ncbi:pentapeptide repeat-containing protein [Rickettsia endosymbiont of Halotydeus destructor]|uniref:pentapeptide repeat-containing protein n=1 Tax=Rickettsia endosymbiont of Halotydeus destructor TaxID=2996754 RepID=UPI003BAF9E4A
MATTRTIKNNKLQENFRKAIKRTLSSSKTDKVVSSLIRDLASPKKESFSISFKTMLKGAKFILSNPVNTWNIYKLAKSSDTYLDQEFQQSLLEKSEIWEFLKKHADDLPKIGQILAKAGFKEFQDGNFLDQKGLEILKNSFNNEETLKNLQEIAIETRKEIPDWSKVTSKTLEMLNTDKNFQKFFSAKGDGIKNYIKVGANTILADDYIRTFDDILQKPENKNLYPTIIKIFDKNPTLKQTLAENINNPAALSKFNLNPDQKIAVEAFLTEVEKQAAPSLKEYFENYKIDTKVLDTVPTLLSKIPEAKEIFDTLNNPNQGVMVAVQKSLEMITKDEKLKDFFANNKEFLPNMALGVIENTPNLQNMTKEYGFDKQMLSIVGEVMSKPDVAQAIITDMNKGDYMSVTSDLIAALNDPSFKLKDILVEQSKNGLFDNLIKGVLEQDEKGNKIIKEQLTNYGLEAKDVTKLTSMMPILLDKPESLQKVFSGFIKGDYTAVAKELIILTKDNPEIKEYLNNNKEIFANILDKTLVEVPGINKLNKKELYNILPSMLNHPDELVKIIDGVEKGDYRSIATNIYSLAQKTNYFEGQVPSLTKAVIDAGLNYAAQKVTDIFSSEVAFKDQTIDGVALRTMIDKVKNNQVNLEGAKLVGDLSNIDFTGISLKNVDLSNVTSLKDCNLKDTNLEGAILPSNLTLLNDTYNLDKTTPILDSALIKAQQDKLIDKAVDKVWLQAQSEGTRDLPDKKEFGQQIKILCKENPELKDYITEKLNLVPLNMVGDVSSPKVNQHKHATNHIDSPLQVLNPLYENIVKNQDVKANLVANIISEQVISQLFSKGDNRGEDFYMTRQMLKQVVSDYSKENPNNVDNLLEPKNQKDLINNIEATLKSKSKYTLAGLGTGGSYLPKEIFNEELKNNLKNEFQKSAESFMLVKAKNIVLSLENKVKLNNSKSSDTITPPTITPTSSKILNKNKEETHR